MDRNGLPVLESPRPLLIKGWNPKISINSHIHMQSVDIDMDGRREIVVCVQADGPDGHVCHRADGETALEDTGLRVPDFMEWWLLDVDVDGELELVYAGSEHGLGYYRKARILES